MATGMETFRRKETKYRLNASQLAALEECARERMQPDAYFRSRVSSLYYDTPDRRLIERSLEKPLYKEKVRVRWYEARGDQDAQARTPDGGAVEAGICGQRTAFVELKKKFKGIVYKRRVAMDADQALRFMERAACADAPVRACAEGGQAPGAALAGSALQVVREVEAFCRRHAAVEPSALIVCERTAYAGLTDAGGALRITFDEALRGSDVRGRGVRRLEELPEPSPLIGAGEAIMEVKSEGAYPLWLARALGACGAHPTSFSKYGHLHRQKAPR